VTMVRTRRYAQETQVSGSPSPRPLLAKPCHSCSDLPESGKQAVRQQRLSDGDEIGIDPSRVAQDTNRGGITNADIESRGNAYSQLTSLAGEVLLAGKWKIQILCAMRTGPIRLGQLARLISNASRKMITHNLRNSEGYGIVIRKDLSDISLHVEYDLEPLLRESICSLLDELAKWGDAYLRKSIQESCQADALEQYTGESFERTAQKTAGRPIDSKSRS
jgi:DNA-binding HxlR family transcriptional regulator